MSLKHKVYVYEVWHQQYIQVIWNTCTYKWYGISYSGCNQDVPNLTFENEQQILRVLSYLVQTNFNEMKMAYVQDQLTDVYFS